jgi:glucokinase-like ROK family protein
MANSKISTADQVWVRKMNRSVILETLRTRQTLSRAGLAVETGLNPSTVSSIISELLEDNLVRETTLIQPITGRPGRLIELNPIGGCAIGVEINVDYLSIILTDFTANILWRQRLPSNPHNRQEVILEQVEAMIGQALRIGEESNLRSLGIGVGVPGLVDLRFGKLKIAPNLGWYDVPIRDIITQSFNLPVYVENEANAAALGEYYLGIARGKKNLIYLSTGVGLGAGILIDGNLFRGSHGYASEVGHITFDLQGELCGCGKRGCWETFVGPRFIERRVRRILQENNQSLMLEMINGDLDRIQFGIVVQAAEARDPTALQVLEEVAHNLGLGIANLVNIFNPELIILGGALSLACPYMLPVIELTLYQNALQPNLENLTIAASVHGTDACMMGAVALVLDDILREPVLT